MKHYTKSEKLEMKIKQGDRPFEKQDGQRLQLWQKMYNHKLKKEAKWSESGDQAEYERMKQRHKRFPFIILFAVLFLAVIGLSITGITLAAIDFSHHIFNAKSICFMVFGCLVWFLLVLDLALAPLIKKWRVKHYVTIYDKEEMAANLIREALIEKGSDLDQKDIDKLVRKSKLTDEILKHVYGKMDIDKILGKTKKEASN